METLFIAISSSNISLTCNLIFIGILILCILSCLMGLKKGLIKSSLKFVVWLILILVVYLCNVNIANAVYNTSISFIINTFNLNQSIVINEVNVSLTQTIGSIVSDILKAYNISSSYEAISALSISIISFVTLIIDMLLCLLISPIITFVLYICLIKPIFNKVMKKHKLRIGGLFVNGLKTLMVSTAFLMPLFSVTEVMISNYNDAVEKGYTYDEQTSNKYWNILYPFLNGYNSSALHGFFSILTGQGRNNGFYTVNVKNSNTKVNFVDILGDAFAVTCSTLSVAPDVSQSALISALLTDNTLELFTTKILNNAFLVKEVLPITASIALNLISNNEDNVILSKEDAETLSNEIGNIDFGNDLSSYVELFRILNENNYISNSITTESFEYKLSRENQNTLNKALSKFKDLQNEIKSSGKKTLIEVILPPILSSLVKNAKEQETKKSSSTNISNDIWNIFPNEAEEYRKYNLIEIVQCLSDILFNFNELYKLAGNLEDDLKIAKINTLNLFVLEDSFFDEDIVFGKKGNVKTMDLFTGRTGDNDKTLDKGLLDIPFVLDSIPALLDFSLGMIGNDFISSDAIEEIKQEISTLDNNKETWTEEFSMMFEFISKLYNKSDLPILIKGENGIVSNKDFSINLANEKQRNILKSAIMCIGDSKIIPSIISPIIKNNLNFDWQTLGINVDSFNFKIFSTNNNLATELIDLIDAFAYATPIIELEENENIFTSGIKADDLELVFNYLIDCEIINPVDPSITKENNVLRQMILKLFNDENIQKIGFSLSSETYDNCADLKLEFAKICSIFRVIENDNSLSSLLNGSNISIDQINGKSLSDWISAITESDFLRPSIDTVLEKSVSPIINDAGLDSSYFDFAAIENKANSKEDEISLWKEEGNNIGVLVDDIKCFASGENAKLDLNQIIKDETNKTKVDEMLVTLTKMHMLSTDYLEDGRIYDRVGLIALNMIEPVLTEYIAKDDASYKNIKDDFSFAKNNKNYINSKGELVEELTRVEKWENEITKFTQIIFSLSSLQNEQGTIVINVTDSNSISAIKEILLGDQINNKYGLNDIIFMRSLFANIMSKALNQAFDESNQLINNALNVSDSYVYFDSFKYEMNYKSDLFTKYATKENVGLENASLRNAEVVLRKNELEHIFYVLETIVDNQDLFEGEVIEISKSKLLFEPLLTNLHASLTFHQPKSRMDSVNEGKLTFFENFVLMALDKANLTTLSSNEIVSTDAKETMRNRIITLSKVEETKDDTGFSSNGVKQDESSYRTWEEEITALNELVVSDATESLIDSNVLNTSDYKNIDNATLESMMKLLNKSFLLHESTSNISRTLLTNVNLESYRIDVNEEATEVNYYIDASEELFNNKIEIWNKEIETFTGLKEAISYTDENGETHMINFETYDFVNGSVKVEDVLPLLQKLKIVKPMFYDFTYKAIEKMDLVQYISTISDSPNVYSGYATKFEGDTYQLEKQKRDTLKYLGEEKINQRNEIIINNEALTSWQYESRLIDNVIHMIKNNASITVEGTLTDEQVNKTMELFSVTYNYIGSNYDYSLDITDSVNQQAKIDMINSGNYQRGYYVSELILNLFIEKVQVLNVNYFNENKFTYNYNCFNDYEKIALEKILSMRRDFVNVSTLDELDLLLNHNRYKEFGPGLYSLSNVPLLDIYQRDSQNILLKDGFNSNLASEIIDEGYLEEAIKLSPLNTYLEMFNIDITGIFAIDHNYPIETNVEYIWKERINERKQSII